MNQKLIFLMGVSGSGKNTVQPGLLADESLQLEQVNTTTTRPLRPGENHGLFYDFVSQERFDELIQAGDFIEYALVHDKYYYGTRKSLVQDVFSHHKNVLKQLDIHGWEQIVHRPEVRSYARSVFMTISDETIRQRILSRDETIAEEEIQRRLMSAHYERQKATELCDVVIDVEDMTPEEQCHRLKDLIVGLL
ncbi:MAG: guanylate kinase [Candidatus Peribacteria bacterium]|nr:MAG: guanylate kinase [Candidatus Peribacteria bacterium]